MKKLDYLLNEKSDGIFKEIRQQYEKAINDEIKKRFNINYFELKEVNYNEYYVKMDKHYVEVEIDQYNNLYLRKISGELPFEYIKKFRELFNDYLEHEDTYNHRAGCGFMIDYLRKYCDNISKTLLENMCKLDDNDGEKHSTFREWVYGSSCDYYIQEKFNIRHDRWQF